MMNRRYAFLWLVTLAATAFGQQPRLSQLEDCLRQQGYYIGHNINNTDYVIKHTLQGFVYARGADASLWPDSMLPQRRQQLVSALDAIREAFTDLSKEESESHLYENHKNGADTIEYSVGFLAGRKSVPSSHDNRSQLFNSAREAANFTYKKDADGRDMGIYMHAYHENRGISWDDMKPFDIAAFEAHIQPAFASLKKLKGAYSCPIYWRHDEGFDDDVNHGLHVTFFYNGNKQPGLATGTRYFIPAQYKAEANALFRQLDALAYEYVSRHRDQVYEYRNKPEDPYYNIQETFSGEMVWTHGHQGSDNYALIYRREADGLHILSLTSKGEAWMPKEWAKLKSYTNGKKVYLKATEQAEYRMTVAEAIAARQWHVDITSMNTMRYGSRSVTPDFYLELHGNTLRSYLPYLGQAQASPTLSPSKGLNFEAPVQQYKVSRPKSKKYTQLDIDVRTQEDSYHYVINLYNSGEAIIRVRSLNCDPISFDGTLETLH